MGSGCLQCGVREGLFEEVTLEPRPEWRKGERHVKKRAENQIIPLQGTASVKNKFASSRNSKKRDCEPEVSLQGGGFMQRVGVEQWPLGASGMF